MYYIHQPSSRTPLPQMYKALLPSAIIVCKSNTESCVLIRVSVYIPLCVLQCYHWLI